MSIATRVEINLPATVGSVLFDDLTAINAISAGNDRLILRVRPNDYVPEYDEEAIPVEGFSNFAVDFEQKDIVGFELNVQTSNEVLYRAVQGVYQDQVDNATLVQLRDYCEPSLETWLAAGVTPPVGQLRDRRDAFTIRTGKLSRPTRNSGRFGPGFGFSGGGGYIQGFRVRFAVLN